MDTKTCKACGQTFSIDNFYKANGNSTSAKCKPCHKAYTYAWNKSNPERRKIIEENRKLRDPGREKRKWNKQKNDPEYIKQKKIYHQIHRDKYIARASEWNKNNREKTRKHVKRSHDKRRAVKSGGKGFYVSQKEIDRLYASACAFCGSMNNICIDHIFPIVKGGSHSIGNLQPLCKSCNSRKKDMFVSEYKYFVLKRVV